MKENIHTLVKLFRYNQKIIFANKFIYFLLAAFAYFIIFSGITIFQNDIFNEAVLFSKILIPGMLIIFYPACFGIQNDQDSKIIEILFGIPNYRYKVWLVRLLMIYLVTAVALLILGILSYLLLIDFNPLAMMGNMMFPIIFCGNLAFMLSVITRSGNGTAVIMIVIGLLLFLFKDAIEFNKWNLFLNPYTNDSSVNPVIFQKTVLKNHLILSVGAVITLITGLLNLQKREKFI